MLDHFHFPKLTVKDALKNFRHLTSLFNSSTEIRLLIYIDIYICLKILVLIFANTKHNTHKIHWYNT